MKKTRAKAQSMPELRNQDSGGLDAKKATKAFGMLSFADVSRSIERGNLQADHGTPDSKALQKPLFSYERIASALSQINNAWELWCNSPTDTVFQEKQPVDLIIKGRLDLFPRRYE